MPLPGRLNEKYLARFDELIEEARNIPAGEIVSDRFPTGTPWNLVVDADAFHRWQTRVASLLDQVVPSSSVHRRVVEHCLKHSPNTRIIQQLVGCLQGLKDDYEKGFLDDLPSLIRAELAADYLVQAETLLSAGYHVPAAVLAGAVLEDALRTLCIQQSIPLETDKGKRKTINPLNDDLAKVPVYNAAKTHEIRAWADLRNKAAHGEGDQIAVQDVARMIDGVRSFVGDHLK